MYTTRDIAIVILVSALGFVYAVLIGQIPFMVSGIPGSNYIFHFGYAILVSFALLMYSGRRWRFLLQGIVVSLLFLPTSSTGNAFDIISRIPTLCTAFLVDIFFNSVYSYFDQKKKLQSWAVLSTVGSGLIHFLLMLLTYYLFYSTELFSLFFAIISILVPVIVIENIFGALIGYKIYKRVNLIWYGNLEKSS